MKRRTIRRSWVPALALGVALSGGAAAGELKQAVDKVVDGNQKSAKAQERIDKLSEQAGDLLAQFRQVQQEIASIQVYNAQVQKLLDAQRGEITGLEGEIEKATNVGREMTPLMLRMIDALSEFVSLDVPFLPEERGRRMAELRAMMDRANVADSEKYQRILEAYQIENEFGRTIEAYKGNLKTGEAERTVNYLRVGRVAFLYLTLDAREAGVWNQAKRAWEILPAEYRKSVEIGLRIARKEMAPDLIRLPIPAAEDAR